MARIAVWIVTFRRPVLLRRALSSVLQQTHHDLVVRVVNDDPNDPDPGRIVEEANDPRAALFRPLAHRGGAANFNLAFAESEAPLVSLLEDDNWWEPEFLEIMHAALLERPGHAVAISNERIWRELPDGDWQDTGETIWPFSDVREHDYSPEGICGPARLVNSAMLVRLAAAGDLRTPDDIPVDITEHYRERLLSPSLLMVGRPLTNYAVTLQTFRATAGPAWGLRQALLVGSVFAAVQSRQGRQELASRLWKDCPSVLSPRAVSLVCAGIAIPEARSLLTAAPPPALARFGVWAARHPRIALMLAGATRSHAAEFEFLSRAPLTLAMAERLGA